MKKQLFVHDPLILNIVRLNILRNFQGRSIKTILWKFVWLFVNKLCAHLVISCSRMSKKMRAIFQNQNIERRHKQALTLKPSSSFCSGDLRPLIKWVRTVWCGSETSSVKMKNNVVGEIKKNLIESTLRSSGKQKLDETETRTQNLKIYQFSHYC